ncbi:dynein axonemal assembly factor 3 homolog [Euwallacea fornicatus]|uniref:dynein axonemal assembly factor 3 homolog n=1 Tax=Euwallacea fornicatus TaxID=995702 RepID=UPI0033904E96
MFWGITPALDLIKDLKESTENKNLPSVLNMLIVGGTDSRHVLQTLARRYRHDAESVQINFYLMEACMETVAKQLLLMYTAFQPKDSLGSEQKTRVFMELYGNTLVRQFTAKYLSHTANAMVNMITNYDYLNQKMDFLSLDIKYKERDYLENVVKFWGGKDEFNIVDMWDRRIRKKLGVRYDSKMGVFDWDLHMRLHLAGARQICDQEYRMFRLNGMAYSWLESEMARPNRSLVCGILQNGQQFAHYGYLGDMETGPFVTFGLECEDKSFLRNTNGQNFHRSTDVIERNLKQIFHEIEHSIEYVHVKKNDLELGHAVLSHGKMVVDMRAPEVTRKEVKSCIKLKNVSIKFLTLSLLKQMLYKESYWNFFNVVYFGHNYLRYFDREVIVKIMRESALLVVEHPLFKTQNRKKDLKEYAKKVEDKLGELKVIKFEFNLEKDCYMKFIMDAKKQ